MRLVAVIGGDPCSALEYAAARAVGHGLATAGFGVVTGGRGGVMEAASRGARDAGGVTVALLPGEDRAAANAYADIVIPTGLGEARNVLVAAAGEVVVAVGGRLGTLSEMSLALRRGTAVVSLGSWELAEERLPDAAQLFFAQTADEAVGLATNALRG